METAPQKLAEMIDACEFVSVGTTFTEVDAAPFEAFSLADSVDDVSRLEIFRTNGDLTTAELEAEMDRSGYRSETLMSLLDYIRANPDPDVEHFLVALGSCPSEDGYLVVPYTYKDDEGRRLSQEWILPENRWHKNYCFLVSRKS